MTEPTPAASGPVDALLVLSFGGPEGQEDVIPFLENVTRGRGIPRERLEEVATHYRHLGGRSPINDLNRDIIANIEEELESRGRRIPVYFGNRNWTPFAGEAVQAMVRDGISSAAVFATSAWGGYSGCAQYQEDISRVREEITHAPEMIRLRQFYDHPLFIERFATDLRSAVASAAPGSRVIFTAHSVPNAADKVAGPPELGGHLYSRQVHEASRLVAEAAGVGEYDVVWQSRSGPPHIPWLEPDVVDHVRELASSHGVTDVVVVPIGFISDHVEVIWDLDTELVDEIRDLGVTVTRCATPGPSAEFARMVVDLIDEVESTGTAPRPGSVPSLGRTRNGKRCSIGCCAR